MDLVITGDIFKYMDILVERKMEIPGNVLFL